jgi:hypothetical protein
MHYKGGAIIVEACRAIGARLRGIEGIVEL